MSEPMRSFTREILNIDDIVVYLKDGCKFIGQIIGFVDTKAKIRRFSPPNTFVTPEETQDYGEVSVNPGDVVGIIIRMKNIKKNFMSHIKIKNLHKGDE